MLCTKKTSTYSTTKKIFGSLRCMLLRHQQNRHTRVAQLSCLISSTVRRMIRIVAKRHPQLDWRDPCLITTGMVFRLVCTNQLGPTETYSYVFKTRFSVSLALFSTDKTLLWEPYVRLYVKEILLTTYWKWRLHDCEGQMRRCPQLTFQE